MTKRERQSTQKLLLQNAYWNSEVLSRPYDMDRSYEIHEFNHNPGLHFEKIGRLHHTKGTWKLVIKVNLEELTQRYGQIEKNTYNNTS